jgi:guanine deaminase
MGRLWEAILPHRTPAAFAHTVRMGEIIRASIFHTPENPFRAAAALEVFEDGGLVIEGGVIRALGDYAGIRKRYPDATVRDLRGGYLLPGFVDTHVHYPQIRVLGGLGYSLLDWLDQHTLPEEARLAEPAYAREIAQEFLHSLASHGTTTALVFGSHFAPAMEVFFDAAVSSGLRIASGLVLSDRMLLPSLHQAPDQAYRLSQELIRNYHGKNGLLYAVTPRFALSSSDAMLEVCQSLLRESSGIRFQTHINENPLEVMEVARLFPWASDYLAVYEKFSLVGRHSVLAHNVHPTDGELARLAASGATVAHCPCSNAALGSGIFPMQRHLSAGVRFALGTDVGGGTGFGMLKEGLQAYMLQRVSGDGVMLNPAQLLYLATRAGAEALGLENETGDLRPGKSADYVYLQPVGGSPLAAVAAHAELPEDILSALFTLAGQESVREVCVRGKRVLPQAAASS